MLSKEARASKVFNKILLIHNGNIFMDKSTFVNVNTKTRFIDKDFGEWWAIPYNVSKGHGHPKRGHIRTIDSTRISLKEIKERIFKNHGDIVVLDESTYSCLSNKARFIDFEFGEWWTLAEKVINYGHSHPKRNRLKFKSTIYRKYGVLHPSQVPQFAVKIAKAQKKSHILYHWKTNEEVICYCSYEKKVVEYLNKNKIDFDWQIPFDMPDGKRYFVDLHLKEQDLWVEIKGYKRPNSMKKWDWFYGEHPNSELWDQKTLKQKGLIVR